MRAFDRGSGRGCALALAEAGCDVVINGRDKTSLADTDDGVASPLSVMVTPVMAEVESPKGSGTLMSDTVPHIQINDNAGRLRHNSARRPNSERFAHRCIPATPAMLLAGTSLLTAAC